jgi:hypothetical protein
MQLALRIVKSFTEFTLGEAENLPTPCRHFDFFFIILREIKCSVSTSAFSLITLNEIFFA